MTEMTSYSIAKTFNIQDIHEDLAIDGPKNRISSVPAIDPLYQFRKEVVADFFAWWKSKDDLGDSLLIFGPTGSGKSSVVKQIMARLNFPVQQYVGNKRSELIHLIGSYTFVDGETLWVDGPLITAMRYGHLFLFDEIDLVDPSILAGLNGVFEGDPITLPNGGEVVYPHDNFRVVATGNTNGGGDSRGVYQGANIQNLATMDRFMLIHVDYPDPEQEERILEAKVPQIPEVYRKKMVEVANEIRGRFMAEDEDGDDETSIEVTMSSRTLIRWAYYSHFYKHKVKEGISPMDYAMRRALGLRATSTTQVFLAELCQRHFSKQ